MVRPSSKCFLTNARKTLVKKDLCQEKLLDRIANPAHTKSNSEEAAMDERAGEPKGTGMNRRRFIGALGAAATAGAILQTAGGGR